MSGNHWPLRADNDTLEAFPCANHESCPAILEPVGAIVIKKGDEVEGHPRRRPRAITNTRQELLIDVLLTGKT